MMEIYSGRSVSLQSGHQPQFLTGLDANKSATPGIGDTYYATDTGLMYVCFFAGTWASVSSIEEYKNHLGTTDQMMSTTVTGTFSTEIINHTRRLKMSGDVAGYSQYQANYKYYMMRGTKKILTFIGNLKPFEQDEPGMKFVGWRYDADNFFGVVHEVQDPYGTPVKKWYFRVRLAGSTLYNQEISALGEWDVVQIITTNGPIETYVITNVKLNINSVKIADYNASLNYGLMVSPYPTAYFNVSSWNGIGDDGILDIDYIGFESYR